MITVLSTGISGCGEKEYFSKFVQYCDRRDKKVNLISVTDVVLEIARETHPEINRYNMLNFPITTRNLWYQMAFDRIIEEKLKKDAVNIINMHLTYWWKEGPEAVVDAKILTSFFSALNPIFVIQITDGVKAIKERIDKVAQHVGRALSLESVIRWREMECYVTEMFAQIIGKKYYLIARAQPPDTLYRLIFTNEIKVYFSFPITFATNHLRKKAEAFAEELNKLAIVFNPFYVERYESFPSTMKKLAADVIIKRDYRLINQSDLVVAYFPKVVPSSGIVTEMNYANSTGKIVYLVWPHRRYSPWTIYPARKVFSSTKSCLEEIKAVAGQRRD